MLFVSDFVAEHGALMATLMDTVAWDERMKARKTACFGVPYNYSDMVYPACPMPPALAALLPGLNERIGFEPNSALLNLYPDGQARMGFHSDRLDGLEPGTGVAIVSLGAARQLIYQRKGNKRLTHAFELNPGSLLYMDDGVQEMWKHGVPSAPEIDQPRISCTFRRLVV